MENNGNEKTVLLGIKIHKGKFADIGETERAFSFLIYNMHDITNQKSLYNLSINTGYAMGCLGMCRYLGILDQPDVDKLAAVVAKMNTEMTKKITKELKNGNGE